MIAFLARFIGLWLIAGGLVAFVIDGTRTIAASRLTVTPLGHTWSVLSPSSLAAAEAFVRSRVDAYVGGWLWDPVIQWVLMLPSWLVLGAVGAWLVYAGRKRTADDAFAA